MDKIDPRLYYEGHKPTVVEECAVNGRWYCIASLGRYPTAYVTCTAKELEAAKRLEGDAPCHGGITFYAKADSEALPPALGAYGYQEQTKCPDPFVGWDYGWASDHQTGDREIYGDDTHGKIWTVEEIRADVWAVAKWLDGLTVDRKPTVDDARRRLEALGCPLTAIPLGSDGAIAVNDGGKVKTVAVARVVMMERNGRPYIEYLSADGEARRVLLNGYGETWAESAEDWGKARAWRLRGGLIPQ